MLLCCCKNINTGIVMFLLQGDVLNLKTIYKVDPRLWAPSLMTTTPLGQSPSVNAPTETETTVFMFNSCVLSLINT